MKKQTETIDVAITVDHYGFYPNDYALGEVCSSYKEWVEFTTEKEWQDYECGSWSTDIEMIDDWIEETNQPYETLWSEKNDGIYLVDKDWRKKYEKI